MRRGVLFAAAVAAAVAAVVAAVGTGRREVPPPDPEAAAHPNVVVVIGCTVRADQTTLFAPDLDTTPTLAALAADGVVFDDAITAAPWTRPASVAVLTGRHPGHVGLLEPGAAHNDRAVPEELVLLAERFADAGYVTIGRTANPNLDATYGFDQGFSDYANLSPRWRGGVTKIRGGEVVDDLLAAVDRAPPGPLYLQVMLVDAHQPNHLGPAAAWRWEAPGIPPRVSRYRAMLRTFDGAVEALITGLSARGLDRSNTVFVVVNDHGEGLRFPAHHGRGHGRYLYPSTTRMVWVMAGPGVEPGRRIGGLASQVDVAPTLLELVGLEGSADLDGQSWASLVGGAGERTTRRRAFSATMFADVERGAIFTDAVACLSDFGSGRAQESEARRNKPIFEPGCFDRADPGFTTRIAAPDLERALALWWRRMAARNDGALVREAAVPDGVRRALEALGYVGDREGDPSSVDGPGVAQ